MTALAVIPPADQQRWHELYKSAALVIILLYIRTRGDRAVTQVEIADNFMIARNTAAAAMRKLCRMGVLAHYAHNDGYILTDGGQQMLLNLYEQQGCSKVEHPSLSLSLKELKDSKEKKERKKERDAQNLTLDQILAQTGKLFPHRQIVSFGLDKEIDPDYVLAWLAQAYDQHQAGRVSHPWALVYKRLKTNNSLPEKKYQVEPERYLPNEFLAALGLEAPEVIDIDDGTDWEWQREIEITTSIDKKYYEAWEKVLEHLDRELPRASFETWLRETYAAQFENQTLYVAARNRFAVDWLKSQMTARCEALLKPILGDVQVRFVVLLEESEDAE